MQRQKRKVQTDFAAPSMTVNSERIESTAMPSPFEISNRQKDRSLQLMQGIHNVDLSADSAYLDELMGWINDRYNERMGGVITAIFARCYLGGAYIDHHISLVGNIIEHYEHHQTVPVQFQQARALLQSGPYEFVEIYSDGENIPVREDGSPG